MNCNELCSCCIDDKCFSYQFQCNDLQIECKEEFCPLTQCETNSSCYSVSQYYKFYLNIYDFTILALFWTIIIYLFLQLLKMKKNIIIPMKIMARKSYHESLSYRESKSRLFQ